jgi:hypothetical protein
MMFRFFRIWSVGFCSNRGQDTKGFSLLQDVDIPLVCRGKAQPLILRAVKHSIVGKIFFFGVGNRKAKAPSYAFFGGRGRGFQYRCQGTGRLGIYTERVPDSFGWWFF